MALNLSLNGMSSICENKAGDVVILAHYGSSQPWRKKKMKPNMGSTVFSDTKVQAD